MAKQRERSEFFSLSIDKFGKVRLNMTKENPKECLEVIEKCYPEMKPYVGAAHDHSGRNGLMLVGENFI